MKNQLITASNIFTALAFLSSGFLIYIMISIPLFKEDIFINRDTVALSELFIIAGFLIMLLFILSSVLWLSGIFRRSKESGYSTIGLMILGGLCFFLFFGEKVMFDEIGNEYILGWETSGEWIILYGFLFTQLVYHSVFIYQILRRYGILFKNNPGLSI
ncbi:hypothetical protein ACFL7D_07970 [candidate division KSB1 bacterium]